MIKLFSFFGDLELWKRLGFYDKYEMQFDFYISVPQ
jgi:hypothetical protein